MEDKYYDGNRMDSFRPCNVCPTSRAYESIQAKKQMDKESEMYKGPVSTPKQQKKSFWKSLFGEKKANTCVKRKEHFCCKDKGKSPCFPESRNVCLQNVVARPVCKCCKSHSSYSRKRCHPSPRSICSSYFYINIGNLSRHPKGCLCSCQKEEQKTVIEKIQLDAIREIKLEPNRLSPLKVIELSPTVVKDEADPSMLTPQPSISAPIQNQSEIHNVQADQTNWPTDAINSKSESIKQDNYQPLNIQFGLTYEKTETKYFEGADCCRKVCEEKGIRQIRRGEEENGCISLKRNESSNKILTLEINDDRIILNHGKLAEDPEKNDSAVIQDSTYQKRGSKTEGSTREALPSKDKGQKEVFYFQNETNEADVSADNKKYMQACDPSLDRKISDILKKVLMLEEKIECFQSNQTLGKRDKKLKIAINTRKSSFSLHRKDSRKHLDDNNPRKDSGIEEPIKGGAVIEIRQVNSQKYQPGKTQNYLCDNNLQLSLEDDQSKKNPAKTIIIQLPNNSPTKITRCNGEDFKKGYDSYSTANDNCRRDENDNYKRVYWNGMSDDSSPPTSPPNTICYCYECTYKRNHLIHSNAKKCFI